MTRPAPRAPLAALLTALLLALTPGTTTAWAAWHIGQHQVVGGLNHPESAAWDQTGERVYLSNFGQIFKSAEKDGQGYISVLDARGRLLEERLLPGPDDHLSKPKGIWVAEGRLWAADIDKVWVFDLASRRGRSLVVPGAQFLNDVVVGKGRLYVSDTVRGRIHLVEPADFLDKEPSLSLLVEQAGLAPNGLWLLEDGSLLIAGSPRDHSPGQVWQLYPGQWGAEAITKPLGRLDGLGILDDGCIVFTDWASGGLYLLAPRTPPRLLLNGLKGPADFSLVAKGDGYAIALPDLVTGDLHLLTLEP